MAAIQTATAAPIVAISGKDLEDVLARTNTRDVSNFHRLHISYRRVIKNRADGTVPDGTRAEDRECSLPEYFLFCHPDDESPDPGPRQRQASRYNVFREMGEMFRGNAQFFNVTYTTYDAVLPAWIGE
jgi:hypothetical protein